MKTMIMPRSVLQDVATLVNQMESDFRIQYNSETGTWFVKMVDPAHVAMLTLDFKGIEVVNGDYSAMYLDAEKIKTFLKRTDEGQLTVTYDDDTKPDVDPISVRSVLQVKTSLGGLPVRTTVRCHSDKTYEIRVPTLNLPASCVVTIGKLKSFFKLAAEVTDHVRIAYNHNDKLCSISAGYEDDKRADGTDFIEFYLNGLIGSNGLDHSVSSLFPMDYLARLFRVLDTTMYDDVTLTFGADSPMNVEGVSRTGNRFKFLVAPRIEND